MIILLLLLDLPKAEATTRAKELIHCFVCHGKAHDLGPNNNIGCSDPFNATDQPTVACKGQCTRVVMFDLTSKLDIDC